jgi:hypothetical protein
MNNIISAFCKFCACAAVVIGAPLVAASAVNFTTRQVETYLEVAACKKAAALDQVVKECK